MATAASAALAAASAVSAANWWIPGSLSFELAKGFPAAFVALAIGGCTVWIAHRQAMTAAEQAKVAATKLNLDLFKDRIELYNELVTQMRGIQRTLHYDEILRAVREFGPAMAKTQFLFGVEIGEFFDDVARRNKAYAMAKARAQPSELDQRFMGETDAWFVAETAALRGRFRDYLDFSKWRPTTG